MRAMPSLAPELTESVSASSVIPSGDDCDRLMAGCGGSTTRPAVIAIVAISAVIDGTRCNRVERTGPNAGSPPNLERIEIPVLLGRWNQVDINVPIATTTLRSAKLTRASSVEKVSIIGANHNHHSQCARSASCF